MINKKIFILGFSLIMSFNYLNASDDLDLSDKERQKIIDDREKAKKAKNSVVKTLQTEKYMMDFKYNFLMNCMNNVTSTNDIKECNDSLKIEIKKEDEKFKEEEKRAEEYEKKQEKIKEDNEKAEAKRLKEIEKAEARKQKELENSNK